MKDHQDTVLGLSIGTRRVGFAVFEDTELVEWGIKSFNSKYSVEKCNKIIKSVERMIKAYAITVIALKVPHESSSSEGNSICVSSIKTIAKTKKIRLVTYAIEDIKQRLLPNGSHSKSELAAYIGELY